MKTIKQTVTDHKNAVILSATVALIIIACAFAVYLRLYTGKELWYEMFAAIIGVIITAIITMMLLVGQTDSDEKREKKGKVFEEKLRIYQEYLSTLYDVIKDGKNTNEEKLKLAFKTSSVAMHCAPERVEKISESVKEIFKRTIKEDGNALEKLSEEDLKVVLKNLFDIMEAFKADLYENYKRHETLKWNKTLLNFLDAFKLEQNDGDVPQQMPVNTKDSIMAINPNTVNEEWENKKKEWTGRGWVVKDYFADKNGFMLTLTGSNAGNNNPASVDVGWFNGHYYIQATFWRDPNFAKALKWKYGGRRSYGNWWKYFDKEFYNILEGQLYSNFCDNKELREYIYKWIERLMDIVERENHTIKLQDNVGTREGWTTFTWEWDTLACDYENDKFGRPYFDVKRIKQNAETYKVIIELSNRTEQPKLITQLVQNIDGCSGLIPDGAGNYILEELDANNCDDIPSKVEEWMNKIEIAAKR